MTGLRPCSWVCSPRDCLGNVLTVSGHLCLLEYVSANLNSALSSALLGLPDTSGPCPEPFPRQGGHSASALRPGSNS